MGHIMIPTCGEIYVEMIGIMLEGVLGERA